MAQLIAAHNGHGIALAADSKAISFDSEGNPIDLVVDRLLPLGDRVAILAGGAAQTVDMARSLQSFIRSEGLRDIEDIHTVAVPYLNSEYERFMRKECQTLHLDPLLYAYFILAGYTERDPDRPTRAYFLWTKKKLPQLDSGEITYAFTAPRRIGLEARLARLCQNGATAHELLELIGASVEKLAMDQDEIGGPFTLAAITTEGLRIANYMGPVADTGGDAESSRNHSAWSEAA